MNKRTMILVTRAGLGEAPVELQDKLAGIFFTLLGEQASQDAANIPGCIAFYGNGVKLVCEGSPVLQQLQALTEQGTKIILCKTCLDYLSLRDHVRIGMIGGMGDILAAIDLADKVISV